LATMVVEGRGV